MREGLAACCCCCCCRLSMEHWGKVSWHAGYIWTATPTPARNSRDLHVSPSRAPTLPFVSPPRLTSDPDTRTDSLGDQHTHAYHVPNRNTTYLSLPDFIYNIPFLKLITISLNRKYIKIIYLYFIYLFISGFRGLYKYPYIYTWHIHQSFQFDNIIKNKFNQRFSINHSTKAWKIIVSSSHGV